ncbi:response regulator [Aliamphritea spongicola]|uniref:response regulator n=1 Tax=Aliamphritea spongicola TaxID=707589 RepID=UPI00196AEEFF|nr:response regulator transcription factor [Aliamphritea spongicola]MBN3561471.1 response regulator transcription factor [Aliamphritea spongicola]
MRILLIEDDPLLGQGVQLNLQQRGYRVDWVEAGEPGVNAVFELQPELVILDLNLPDIDGLEVLRRIRREVELPVLILTARDAVNHRIEGLDNGADDYLVKPFDLDELEARLRALQRRAAGRSQAMLTYRDIRIDTQARQVFFLEELITLGRREYELLVYLLESAGRVLTRRQIEEQLYENDLESNALEVHVHNLRKKLGKELVKTVRGVGYFVES